jgi:hypothetical protein
MADRLKTYWFSLHDPVTEVEIDKQCFSTPEARERVIWQHMSDGQYL